MSPKSIDLNSKNKNTTLLKNKNIYLKPNITCDTLEFWRIWRGLPAMKYYIWKIFYYIPITTIIPADYPEKQTHTVYYNTFYNP